MFFAFVICILLPAISTESNDYHDIGGTVLADFGYQNQLRDTNFYYPYRKLNVQGNRRSWHIWQDQDRRRGNTNDAEDSLEKDDRKSSELRNVDANSRRFGWFSFFKRTTPKTFETTVTTPQSTDHDNHHYENDLKERIFLKELHTNLTEALAKIYDIQKRVSQYMESRETRLKIRSKRDTNVNEKETQVNKTSDSNNVTETTEASLTSTHCACEIDNINNTNGRRFDSSLTPTDIKIKLLSYLDESFLDIKNKIKSLKSLKTTFADDYSFRIGYIVANIDTLETNLSNMKNNTDRNKDFWGDRKILELYDTLKVSNQAVSGLIESLKMYIGQLASSKTQSNVINNFDALQNVRLKDDLLGTKNVDITG